MSSVQFPWPTLQQWINPCKVVLGRKSYSVAYFDQITVFHTNAQFCFTLLWTGLAYAAWMPHACSNRQQLSESLPTPYVGMAPRRNICNT